MVAAPWQPTGLWDDAVARMENQDRGERLTSSNEIAIRTDRNTPESMLAAVVVATRYHSC